MCHILNLAGILGHMTHLKQGLTLFLSKLWLNLQVLSTKLSVLYEKQTVFFKGISKFRVDLMEI
jgi:hypothetical protein